MKSHIVPAIRALIGLAALVVVGLLTVVLFPAAIGFGPILLGRTAPCPRAEALRGFRQHMRVGNGEDEIKSACRLVKTDQAGFSLFQTPEGPYWIPSGTDPKVLPALLSQQRQLIYGVVHAGDVVLDCGAHIGVFVRRALKAGAKLVVAIEPGPENVECMRRNFEQEIHEGRVIIYPKGVWDKEDTLVLHRVAGNSAGDSLVFQYGEGEAVKVPLTTIDNLVGALRLPHVDFIKMDIKGAEKEALHGGAATIRSSKPRLAIASEHLPEDPQQILAFIKSVHPDYRSQCGSCYMAGGLLRPEVLLFE